MSVSLVNGNHEITKTNDENIFLELDRGPLEFRASQCATNELLATLFNSMDFL